MTGLFIDTWGWVALLDSRDSHHARVRTLLGPAFDSSTRVFTSWPVISELLTFAVSKRGRHAWGKAAGELAGKLRPLLTDPRVVREVINPTQEEWRDAMDLRAQHGSTPLSLVDCTIPVLCQPRGIRDVVSGDSHVRLVYPGVRLLPDDSV